LTDKKRWPVNVHSPVFPSLHSLLLDRRRRQPATMTEYDYSPDAIERHMEKQRRVENWVHDTRRHTSTTIGSSSSSDRSRTDSYSSSSSSQTFRPSHQQNYRSPLGAYDVHGMDERGRTLHHSYQDRPQSPYTTSSATEHRSLTPPRRRSYSHYPQPSFPPPPTRSYTVPVPIPSIPYPGMPVQYPGYMHLPPPPPGYKVIDSRTGRELPVSGMPSHGPVVIPPRNPHGRAIIVLPPEYRTAPATHPPSSRRQEQPLLKRLFGGFMGSSGPPSSSRGSTSTRRSRRTSY
jgi:hypothetical protein